MRQSKFTEPQIIEILKEAKRVPVADLIRKHAISHPTYSIGVQGLLGLVEIGVIGMPP